MQNLFLHLSFVSIMHYSPGTILSSLSFDVTSIQDYYKNGGSPVELFNFIYDRIDEDNKTFSYVWIHLQSREEVLESIKHLQGLNPYDLPLYGIPFSVKDNINVDGMPTKAACSAYKFYPDASANVVARLQDAGAICIGKTNLDQFATGLNGTRSPYGPCISPFNPQYISGGSSSGSAVSVALQQVSFSIGTDTGGSGRIPASLNNVVGLKPTVGSLSSSGLVPCCPSIDCPSVFALSTSDASLVASVMFSNDSLDPSLREDVSRTSFSPDAHSSIKKVFVPNDKLLNFFGNHKGENLYRNFLFDLNNSGYEIVAFDFEPFLEAGKLLFDGPFLADRYASIGLFLEENENDVLESTFSIVSQSKRWSAHDVFVALEKVKELKSYARHILGSDGIFAFPTIAPLYTIAQLLDDPIALNTNIGYYSYFANILDFSALSVPLDFHENGMPFGITLMGSAFADSAISGFAQSSLFIRNFKLGLNRN